MNSMCRLGVGLVFCAVSIFPAITHAHGPQIQIGIDNNQIVTRSLFANEPYNDSVTPNQRVYEILMAQRAIGDANDGWYAQPNDAFPYTGPGIATALGGFSTDSILGLSFTDGLKLWDGLNFIDPGLEQIDAYRGSAHVAGAVTSDLGPFNSFSFTAISNNGDEHKTAFFRLLGDGVSPNTASDDGVYLLGLRLMSDQLGVNPSDPYYFLLNKNASPATAAAALAYVNTHLVPEPTTGGLLAVSAMLLTVQRRKRG